MYGPVEINMVTLLTFPIAGGRLETFVRVIVPTLAFVCLMFFIM